MDGFFPESEVVARRPAGLLPLCEKCGLYKDCLSPKMPPTGQGRKRILVLGEAPGANEDKQGRQFVGKTGQLLRGIMSRVVDPDVDCWFTNALICRPPDNKIEDDDAVDYCRPNLLKTIRELDPDVVLCLGHTAVKSLVSYCWKPGVGQMEKWCGWKIPCQKINAWICPTWHPSFINRQGSVVMDRMWAEQVLAACELEGKPYEVVPNYKAQVDLLYNPADAAAAIGKINRAGGTISFDYESDRLKPEDEFASIVCASICWEGERAIAFPWSREVASPMRELLSSDSTRKIAANLKHEEKWTRNQLGVPVRNWWWDTVVGAHVIDNRDGISSLKFQSFVLLGQESYNHHIDPYLKADTGNSPNRIREVGMTDLLSYCGLDSLMTYHVAMKQTKVLGWE